MDNWGIDKLINEGGVMILNPEEVKMTKKEQEYKMTGILYELYGENDCVYIKIKSNNVLNTIFNAIKLKDNNIEITIKEIN